MRALIKTWGHQHYTEQEGEVVEFCKTVEKFDGKYMQVPALMLRSDESVWVVSLKREMYDIGVEITSTVDGFVLTNTTEQF